MNNWVQYIQQKWINFFLTSIVILVISVVDIESLRSKKFNEWQPATTVKN
jgi:hypothetical protein